VTAGAPPNGNLPPDQMRARAMDPAAMRAMVPQAPQRWKCAVCVSARRNWEAAHHDVILAAAAQAAASPSPVSPLAFLPEDVRDSLPPVAEAITMATVPNHGPAAVCLGHAPMMADGSRQPLLVATPGLNLAAFAAGMG
jgi:hypothetical protein